MDLVQQRDMRGRFTDKMEPDAELVAEWVEKGKRAKAAEKVCKRFGISLGWLGITKLSGGVWHFGGQSQPILCGLITGFIRARKLTKKEYIQTLLELTEAAGITDKFFDKARKKLGEAQPTA